MLLLGRAAMLQCTRVSSLHGCVTKGTCTHLPCTILPLRFPGTRSTHSTLSLGRLQSPKRCLELLSSQVFVRA